MGPLMIDKSVVPIRHVCQLIYSKIYFANIDLSFSPITIPQVNLGGLIE